MIGIELRASAQQYLALRRAMGYQLPAHDRLIGQLISYLDQQHASRITVEHAVSWACLPVGARPRWHATRLAVARGLAAWLHADCAQAAS